MMIYGSGSESTENEQTSDGDAEEIVVLHRLPGENLGMILGIEGDKTKEHITFLYSIIFTTRTQILRPFGFFSPDFQYNAEWHFFKNRDALIM
jgi:hypothetical protein